MAYIPRPLDTSPSTTMTIRQGGDLINDNFEELADSRDDIESLQTGVQDIETDISALQNDVLDIETDTSALQNGVLDIFDGPDFTNMPSVGGDPIVEEGSNSAGAWIKFSSGLVMMNGILPGVPTETASGSFGLYRSSSTSVDLPLTLVNTDTRISGDNSAVNRWVNITLTTDSSFNFILYSNTSSASAFVGRWHGVGYWK